VRDLASVGVVEDLASGWLGIIYGQRTMSTYTYVYLTDKFSLYNLMMAKICGRNM